MNPKPSQADLMAYLYGELEEDKRLEIESYLASHPEMQKEIEEMRDAREVLQSIPSLEVQAPLTVIHAASPPAKTIHWWKPAMGIAAAFALLLLSAGFAGINAGHNDNGWYFSMGEPLPKEKDTNTESIDSMVQKSLQLYQDSLVKRLDAQAVNWEDKLLELSQSIPNRNTSQNLNVAVFKELTQELRDENIEIAQQLLSIVREEQKDFVESALIQMATQMREQREQELLIIQQALYNLQVKDAEKDVVLTQLINQMQSGE